MANIQHIFEGNGAPSTIPLVPFKLSQHYTDTSNGDQYISNGTASANDWIQVGAGGSGGAGGRYGLVPDAQVVYIELDEGVTASPELILDPLIPFVVIKKENVTGILDLTIKVPDNQNPYPTGQLNFHITFINTGATVGDFNVTWENQTGGSLTGMYTGSVGDLSSLSTRYNYFTLSPINAGSEWATHSFHGETYW